MCTVIKFYVLLANSLRFLALAPSSHVDFASCLVFSESVNSVFDITLMLGTSSRPNINLARTGLFHFLFYKLIINFSHVCYSA